MTTKTTNELKAGDVIVFADEHNKVRDIGVDGTVIAVVSVTRSWPKQPDRTPVDTWFYSGMNADHEVTS